MAVYVSFLLAGIFLVASLSKFGSRKAFHRTLFEIGISRRLIRTAGWLVPAVELCIALLLVIPGTQRAGQIALLLTLLAFAVVAGKALAHKKTTDCNCFGNLLPERLGVFTLVRIMFLIGLTLYLLLGETVRFDLLPSRQLFHQAAASTGALAIYALVAAIIRQSREVRTG